MKPRKTKVKEKIDKSAEYPYHLVELENELRPHPSREVADHGLPSIKHPVETTLAEEKVMQFSVGGKDYAIGRTDRTHADSNHARGVRHIRFYSGETIVLAIEGDFEDQQFGSNFQFHYMHVYTPGEWEADFMKLAHELQAYKDKRRAAFRKKRASDKSRR